MRLWKALHSSCRGKKGVRRADGPRARLEVEALDQRLLPTSFQWGVGRAVDAFIMFADSTPAAPTARTAGYDLNTNKGGALVSSRQVSGVSEIVITKDTDSPASHPVRTSAGMSHRPTESISFVYGSLVRSFSWGEVGSPD
jgi:hypothetical protein